MKNLISLVIFCLVTIPMFSQVDSTYKYICHLTFKSEKDTLINDFKFAIASETDTIFYTNQSKFQTIGLPPDKKIDLIIFMDSNIIVIEDLCSMMKFQLWHYINIYLYDFEQKCVNSTYWNEYGEQWSSKQIFAYLDEEGKILNGVSCHFSEIGSYSLIEYMRKPPKYVLFPK